MLKRVVEVGEYSCQWFIDGLSYPGTVELRASESPRGEIFDLPSDMRSNQWSPGSHLRRKLVGKLRDNSEIVMLDAQVHQWWMDRAAVVAKSAICGLELSVDDLRFDEVEFQVGGLTELAGVAPIERTDFPPGDAESPRRFGMVWRNESEQEWISGSDRINLAFHHRARVFDMYQFSVATYPVVTLMGSPKSIDEWRSLYIDPIREIASLCKADEQSLCWVTLGRKVVEERVGRPGELTERVVRSQLFGAILTQESYLAERGDPTRNAFVVLGKPESSLAEYIERWRAVSSSQQTFFELFMASVRPGLSDRARFLTVTPALESYHSNLWNDEEAIVRHKERRGEVLARIEQLVSRGDYRWIKKNADPRGTPSLERRLADLYDQLPLDVHQQLRATIKPIPRDLLSVFPDASSAWQCVGRLRNDLAHGGPPHSRSEVQSALRLVMTLMIAIALQSIGAPTRDFSRYIEANLWDPV